MRKPEDVTILIVDDEEALRNALVFDFKRKGYQVLDACNGKAAFDIVKERKIDLILTDVRMPQGDGIELLDNTKAYNPELPVVIITGFADISLEDAYNKGVDAVFSKPFDRKELMAAVARAVLAKEERLGARGSDRIQVDFEIELHFSELNIAIQGRAINLGRGGIFVALSEALPAVNARASFVIKYDEGSPGPIAGNCIVRWVRTQGSPDLSTGCGIEFKDLSDQTRLHVIEFINKMKTKGFTPKS